jgi:hypothetical protein
MNIKPCQGFEYTGEQQFPPVPDRVAKFAVLCNDEPKPKVL